MPQKLTHRWNTLKGATGLESGVMITESGKFRGGKGTAGKKLDVVQ